MNDAESGHLLMKVADGDPQALGELMESHRERLMRVVEFRMDRRVRARLDAADVVQEALLVASQRLDDYFAVAERMPFFVWLRFLTIQKLLELHRRHLGAGKRDARQEISLASSKEM